VTRVTLHGGVCPCCAKRFKAEPPQDLGPGSPFGPNLRAFVIYLRSVQGVPLARLSDGLKDLFGQAKARWSIFWATAASPSRCRRA
jgi:transposase